MLWRETSSGLINETGTKELEPVQRAERILTFNQKLPMF